MNEAGESGLDHAGLSKLISFACLLHMCNSSHLLSFHFVDVDVVEIYKVRIDEMGRYLLKLVIQMTQVIASCFNYVNNNYTVI